jgi:hypothetical protein
MPTTPSGNHESLKSKIPKRKKARPNTPLSCRTKYSIKTNSTYFPGRSAFFTDDFLESVGLINDAGRCSGLSSCTDKEINVVRRARGLAG